MTTFLDSRSAVTSEHDETSSFLESFLAKSERGARAQAKSRFGARGAYVRRFEQGLISYHRGHYSSSLKDFEKAALLARETSDLSRFIECSTYILRILAEKEEFAKIATLESDLSEVMSQSEVAPQLRAKALYSLGICSCYQNERHDEAMNRFREAIDAAVPSNAKEALAGPLYGAATVLYARGMFDAALKELSNLEIILNCISIPDIAAAASLLKGLIFKKRGQLDHAREATWSAYEVLRDHPNLVLYLHSLVSLGSIHAEKGEAAAAKLYLELADRSTNREEFPRIARLLSDAWLKLNSITARDMDLFYDSRRGTLMVKDLGEIRFDGQFVMQDMLKAFLSSPGKTLSKSDLAIAVWRENYSPEIHDNKIYVTIKRLRKLLNDDGQHSHFIVRAKNGYHLNPKIRVQIDENPMTPSESAPHDESL
jgi:DNA-binding winged helix-turn-helix (wHTH) protein